MVKILDGGAVDDPLRVLAAATTNVDYTSRLTDEVRGGELLVLAHA